jgi:RNA polymerase sigma factor (sigma-70 family)
VTSEDRYADFVNARASALLRTAILLTAGDRATAEELVQTALVRAYAKRRRVRTPAEAEADARRTLVRAAIRGRRDGARRVADSDPDQSENPLTILDALRALPARQRAVVVLRYHDDYSEAQVAEAVGSATGTVRRHGTRAIETLGKQRSEEQLRSSMEAAVDPVRADVELIARVIEDSRRARRQRRQSWWLTGCGAAALIALVGAGLVYLDGSDDSLPEPDPPAFVEVDPIGWTRQLPQGPPIRLAYVANYRVHVPGRRAPLPLPRDVGMIVGKTSAGWLVTVNRTIRPRKGGLPVVLQYGLATAEGVIERLPQDPYHGSPAVQALSPDGQLFAMGGALVDVAQRRVVGRTPADAIFATEWTPTGLLYMNPEGASSWLWQPGSPPTRLPVRVWQTAETEPVGLTASRGDCTSVVRLTADGGVDVVYDGCASDASSPISLSPDGAYALTADPGVLDLDEGIVTAFELPMNGIAGELGWEDNDHFVFPVESRETDKRDRAVFVRCSIATRECERAGPEFTKPIPEQIQIS